MKRLAFCFCLFSCSIFCIGAEAGKLIVVDKGKFSQVYPAVWFSPSTGEVVPLSDKSERPPNDQYEVWIEPNDPEFRIGNNETSVGTKQIGFSFVGKGAEVFKKTRNWQGITTEQTWRSL